RRQTQFEEAAAETLASQPEESTSVVGSFPDDEPMFAAAEPLHEEHDHENHAVAYEEPHEALAASEPLKEEVDSALSETRFRDDFRATFDDDSDPQAVVHLPAGHVEEQEIEEEEADLAAYAEDLQEDAAFEELEEETHAAGDSSPSDVH